MNRPRAYSCELCHLGQRPALGDVHALWAILPGHRAPTVATRYYGRSARMAGWYGRVQSLRELRPDAQESPSCA